MDLFVLIAHYIYVLPYFSLMFIYLLLEYLESAFDGSSGGDILSLLCVCRALGIIFQADKMDNAVKRGGGNQKKESRISGVLILF